MVGLNNFSLWDSTSWQSRIILFHYQFCSWYPSYVFEYSSRPSCRFSGSTFHSPPLTPRHHPPDPLSPQSVPSSPSSCVQLPGDLFLYFLVQVETTFEARYLSAKKKYFTCHLFGPSHQVPVGSLVTMVGASKCCHSCRSSTPPNAELRILCKNHLSNLS